VTIELKKLTMDYVAVGINADAVLEHLALFVSGDAGFKYAS